MLIKIGTAPAERQIKRGVWQRFERCWLGDVCADHPRVCQAQMFNSQLCRLKQIGVHVDSPDLLNLRREPTECMTSSAANIEYIAFCIGIEIQQAIHLDGRILTIVLSESWGYTRLIASESAIAFCQFSVKIKHL